MGNPLVSVKMITYNHAPYIAQAIEGVLRQETSFPFELVIGEDCSTDGARDIVFNYQKKYPDIIRVITSNENVGVRQNSIRTEDACQGKYMAFCEGDDYWHHPQKLQKQVDYLEAHPDCGLVFSDFNCHYIKNGKRIERFRKYKGLSSDIPQDPRKFLVSMLYGEICILTCTVCVRKELMSAMMLTDPFLYQSDYFKMGDSQRWAGLSQVSKIGFQDESLVTHNLLLESTTQSKDIRKVLRFGQSNYELCVYLAEKYDLPESDCDFYRKRWWRTSLKLAFHEINRPLGREVKKLMQKFSWEEWLLYWGSQSILFNLILRPAVYFRRILRKLYGDDYHL